MEHEDDRHVPGDNEHSQKNDNSSLQDTCLQAFIPSPAQGTRVVGCVARKEASIAAVGAELWNGQLRQVHRTGHGPGGRRLQRSTHKSNRTLPTLQQVSGSLLHLMELDTLWQNLSPHSHIAESQSNEHRLEENQYGPWEARTTCLALLLQSLMVCSSCM